MVAALTVVLGIVAMPLPLVVGRLIWKRFDQYFGRNDEAYMDSLEYFPKKIGLTILKKEKFNFVALVSMQVFAIVGKLNNPEFTNSVFQTADQLVSELILPFVAITLGAFSPNFRLVVLGAIAAFIAAVITIQTGVFTHLIIDYLFAVLITVLGFASIANLYRHYREFSL